MKRIIVAISGASGIDYGIELLKELKKQKIEIHLIISEWASEVMKAETEYSINEVKKLANFCYDSKDLSAGISSSSFLVDSMIIIPASIKTASEIAHADASNLISRAADNILKMRKKLIVCIRETPLSTAALEMLYKLSLCGAIVLPLSPAFYHRPKNLQDIKDFIVGKCLDVLEIENKKFKRWKEK
ncbi:MAG: UbiX family flavin prenyltransferase [archaeon]